MLDLMPRSTELNKGDTDIDLKNSLLFLLATKSTKQKTASVTSFSKEEHDNNSTFIM